MWQKWMHIHIEKLNSVGWIVEFWFSWIQEIVLSFICFVCMWNGFQLSRKEVYTSFNCRFIASIGSIVMVRFLGFCYLFVARDWMLFFDGLNIWITNWTYLTSLSFPVQVFEECYLWRSDRCILKLLYSYKLKIKLWDLQLKIYISKLV